MRTMKTPRRTAMKTVRTAGRTGTINRTGFMEMAMAGTSCPQTKSVGAVSPPPAA